MTVELSLQNQQRSTSNGKKDLTALQSLMPVKAACNSSFGIVLERMGATRHFRPHNTQTLVHYTCIAHKPQRTWLLEMHQQKCEVQCLNDWTE